MKSLVVCVLRKVTVSTLNSSQQAKHREIIASMLHPVLCPLYFDQSSGSLFSKVSGDLLSVVGPSSQILAIYARLTTSCQGVPTSNGNYRMQGPKCGQTPRS